MTSITTFAYGLTVRATGLITAAQAWPSLEPTFQFFDLIFLRKRKGTLHSRMMDSTVHGIVGNVPVEVWEEIRKWVVDVGMEDSEDSMIRQFTIPCRKEDCKLKSLTKLSWEALRAESCACSCPDQDNLNDYLFDLSQGYGEVLEPVLRLTARFGLSHPLSRLVTYSGSYFDLDNVAFVSLPCSTTPHPYSTLTAEADMNSEADQHTIVNVSLKLPIDADSRFVRFIRTFSLEIVEVCHSTIRVVKPHWEERKGPKRSVEDRISRDGLAGMDKDKVKVTKEIKPGWKLYTSCWAEW